MKYGLPYMGSKNKLAVRILDCLPRGGTLVDLFCGGCAVSHAAMCLGRYDHIIINDRDWRCPTLFMDALQGKFKDERRWISREDFHRLKATDPYVAFVWSFGNNLRTYLYGEDIEPFKRAIHYAIYFDDVEPARAFGLDLEWVLSIHGERQRYFAIKHYLQRGGAGVPFPMPGGTPCNTDSDMQICRTENVQSAQNATTVQAVGGGILCRTLHEESADCGNCSTSKRSICFKSPNGGGKSTLSQWITAMSISPTRPSSIATRRIRAPRSMTSIRPSTTTPSTTGVGSRHGRCSSASTPCRATASAVWRSSTTELHFARRATTLSRSGCLCRDISTM